jgi:predicted DNA-binding ribbon-helix-helix protein
VHLERAFWTALHEIAAAQGITRAQLIATIDSQRHDRQQANLSSAIRLFVLDYYRPAALNPAQTCGVNIGRRDDGGVGGPMAEAVRLEVKT